MNVTKRRDRIMLFSVCVALLILAGLLTGIIYGAMCGKKDSQHCYTIALTIQRGDTKEHVDQLLRDQFWTGSENATEKVYLCRAHADGFCRYVPIKVLRVEVQFENDRVTRVRFGDDAVRVR